MLGVYSVVVKYNTRANAPARARTPARRASGALANPASCTAARAGSGRQQSAPPRRGSHRADRSWSSSTDFSGGSPRALRRAFSRASCSCRWLSRSACAGLEVERNDLFAAHVLDRGDIPPSCTGSPALSTTRWSCARCSSPQEGREAALAVLNSAGRMRFQGRAPSRELSPTSSMLIADGRRMSGCTPRFCVLSPVTR